MAKGVALMVDKEMAGDLLDMCTVCYSEGMDFSDDVLAFLRKHFPDVTQNYSYLPTKEEFAIRDKKILDAQKLWG